MVPRWSATACLLVLAASTSTASAGQGWWSERRLQASVVTSATTDPSYGNTLMQALNGDVNASGPILYKTFDGAYYALTSEANILSGIPTYFQSQAVQLGSGSQVVVAADGVTGIVYLGFSASNATLQLMTNPVTSLEPVAFLEGLFQDGPPTINPAVLDPFTTAETAVLTAMETLLAGGFPQRIVCSGHAGGGAWAQLCGMWAFNMFPDANVRVISFGAPLVGDEKWVWTFAQMTDLAYVWVTKSDTIPTSPTGGPLQLNLTRVINDNSTVAGTQPVNSLGYYCQTLNNTLKADPSNIPVTVATNFSYSFLPSEAVSAYAPPPGSNSGIVGSISSFVGNARDSLSAIGSTVADLASDLFGGSSAPAPAPVTALPPGGPLASAPTPGGAPGTPQATGGGTPPSMGRGHSGCEPFLCKIEPAIIESCNVYNNGNGNIGPGSINIGPSPKYGTDVAVQWNASTQVAGIVFRGSSSSVDWVQDFKLWLTESPTSNYFSELYPGTSIHEGFLEQFQEVESNTNLSLSLPYQLGLLSKNNTPVRIDVEGHSLGAGVASIAAVWATLTWPTADVRLVTFGSPKVGNSDWAASALATVGRSYRVVNQLDEVPALPPITDYVALDLALHISNGTVVLSDRAAVPFDDLTWDDHGCNDHYEPGILTATNITVPSWVLALPPASPAAATGLNAR